MNGNYDACRWLGHEYINRKYTEDCDSDTSSLSDTALATVSEEAALRNAAGAGHAAIVTALLAAGADVNVSTKRYGYTPLLCACSQGHAHTVMALLTAEGIDVNQPGGFYPIGIQEWFGGWEAPTPEAGRGQPRYRAAEWPYHSAHTPLIRAAAEGHTSIVTALIATEGIEVNRAVTHGFTALMEACYAGHADVVTALLTAEGIDANTAADDGSTALTLAAHACSASIVSALLRSRVVHVNATTADGSTALILAARKGNAETVNTLLVVEGIDVNVMDVGGDTAIVWATRKGHSETVDAGRMQRDHCQAADCRYKHGARFGSA